MKYYLNAFVSERATFIKYDIPWAPLHKHLAITTERMEFYQSKPFPIVSMERYYSGGNDGYGYWSEYAEFWWGGEDADMFEGSTAGGAINAALSRFGVRKEGSRDEFHVIGLDRITDNSWLSLEDTREEW